MWQRPLPVLCAIAALVALVLVAGKLMPIPGVGFGNDWSYFMSDMLFIDQWGRTNGWLTPAYFTPAFCGGIPFLANPQSMQWSLPQLLFSLFGPQKVPLGTLLLSASVGGWGCWRLARRIFSVSSQFAAFACVLFILNGFLTFRMVAGHATYWTFCAVPWLALLALEDPTNAASSLSLASFARMAGGGLLLALIVFGGALNFVVPVVLGVAVIILMQQARAGLRMPPWVRLSGACVWSIGVSALKLAPAFVMTVQYPREYLARSLIANPVLLLDALFSGFFWPQNLPPLVQVGPNGSTFSIHEFEFGVTIIPLIALLMRGIQALAERRSPAHPVAAMLLVFLLLIPIAVSAGSPEWGAVLQQVPVINNNTLLVRWWSIYIIPLVLFCSISLDRFIAPAKARSAAMMLATALAIFQVSARDLDFYRHPVDRRLQPFDAAPIAEAHVELVSGGSLAPITALGRWPVGAQAPAMTPAPPSMVGGVSSLPCYEPLFGYFMELFPAKKLHAGPITTNTDGFINLADPRCYLGSSDHNCNPGARFAAADPAISRFVTYQTIPWAKPIWQIVAGWTTSLSLLASLSVLVAAGATRRRQK